MADVKTNITGSAIDLENIKKTKDDFKPLVIAQGNTNQNFDIAQTTDVRIFEPYGGKLDTDISGMYLDVMGLESAKKPQERAEIFYKTLNSGSDKTAVNINFILDKYILGKDGSKDVLNLFDYYNINQSKGLFEDITNQKNLSVKDKEKLINKIFNKVIRCLYRDVPTDIEDLKDEFDKELKAQTKSKFSKKGKNLDSILKNFLLKNLREDKKHSLETYSSFISNYFIESFKNKDADIDPDVIEIISKNGSYDAYKKINEGIKQGTGKSIYSLILENKKIPVEKRKEYINHIFDNYLKLLSMSKNLKKIGAEKFFKDEFNKELARQENSLTPSGNKIDAFVKNIDISFLNTKYPDDFINGFIAEEITDKSNSFENNYKKALKHLKNFKDNSNIMLLESNAYLVKNDKHAIFETIFEDNALSLNEKKEFINKIFNDFLKVGKKNGVYIDDIKNQFDNIINNKEISLNSKQCKRLDYITRILSNRIEKKFSDLSKLKKANGKIDADFKQGNTGDCWLLAGIKSMVNNPKTKEFLDDCITVNKDGSVTVELKGVNKKYTIPQKEIMKRNELSVGDLDIRAIEIAVNRYFAESHDTNPNSKEEFDIDGNKGYKAFQILIGNGSIYFEAANFSEQKKKDEEKFFSNNVIFKSGMMNDIIEKIKSNNYLVNVSSYSEGKGCIALRPDGEEERLLHLHAYDVKRADDKYVYIVNPHDSSQELKVTHEYFKSFFNRAYVANIEEITGKSAKS